MNIVCVGDCGIDHYLPSGETRCGGITANFALHARAAFPDDAAIAVISATGRDRAAEMVRKRFESSRIDLHIAVLEGSSSVQYIEIQPDGEKDFVRYDEGVLRDFVLDDDHKRLIASSDLLVAPVFSQIYGFFDRLMSIEQPGLTVVDFADFADHPNFSLLERHIEAIDVGFFGLTTGDRELIGAIRRLAAVHEKLFVVTLGADGSSAFRGSQSFDRAALPVPRVIDTTGAGDAFAAGFLSRYCYGGDIGASLDNGAALAAGIIQRIGAN